MILCDSTVQSVKRPSPASRAGIRSGDTIVLCNGNPVSDWVDLLASAGKGRVRLRVKRGLSARNVILNRGPGEELGIALSGSRPASCRNRCVFCFIDQQPRGLRPSLMIKDDDVRYSFLRGTYITLSDEQTEEALARNFNSIHVSVHSTDPVLRGRILGLPGPAPVLPALERLAFRGFKVEAQIVEIPEWNSGDELARTMDDLYRTGSVSILGVVPVGLTRHRTGLPDLRRHTAEEALRTLELIGDRQERAMVERSFPWVFAADEYYLLAGRQIPEAGHYRDCTLTSNGIGLLAGERFSCRGRKFSGSGLVATGELAADFITGLLKGSDYRVMPVRNELMGSSVGVAGLIGGRDLIRALKDDAGGCQRLFLPHVMFNHDGLTLDGFSLEELSSRLDMEIEVLERISELS